MRPLSNGVVPLAFLLAMASEVTGEAGLDASISTGPLRVGALASLADTVAVSGPTSDIQDETGLATRQRSAQFYPRFANCFAGNWRNC